MNAFVTWFSNFYMIIFKYHLLKTFIDVILLCFNCRLIADYLANNCSYSEK